MNISSLLRDAAEELARGNLERSHQICAQVLQMEPRNPEAHYLLAINCLHRKQVSKAITLLKVATALQPGEGRYWVQLTRAYSQAEHIGEVEKALARSLALEPSDALSVDTLGVILSRMGDHVRAAHYFQQSLQRQPDNPDFLFNLATSLRFNGKLEESYRRFQELYKLQAHRYDIYPVLAELAPNDALTDLQREFESELGRTANAVDARLQISHGLARVLERQDKTALALDVLIRGNRDKRAALAYDSDDDGKLFAGIKKLCNSAFCHITSTQKSSRPIFIVGMPRTGTTLLERIVGSHSAVFAAGELQDFAIGFKRLANSNTPALLDLDTLGAGKRLDYDELGKRYLAQTHSRSGELAHYIDKMPLNFLYAGLIHKALPEARILCLRRHPMDTVLSNFRQLFALRFSQYNYAYDLTDIARYYLQFDELMSHWQEVLPASHFCQVQYETLVENTEDEARRVTDFLQLPWEPQCLDFHASAAPVATASAVQVRQPVYRSSLNRWRAVAPQLAAVKAIFEDAGIDL